MLDAVSEWRWGEEGCPHPAGPSPLGLGRGAGWMSALKQLGVRGSRGHSLINEGAEMWGEEPEKTVLELYLKLSALAPASQSGWSPS